jgi:sensor histidine kinase YesM
MRANETRPQSYGMSIWNTLVITTAGALVTPVFILLLDNDGVTAASLAKIFVYCVVYANAIGFLGHWIMPRLHLRVIGLRAATQWTILILALLGISAIGCLVGTVILANLHFSDWPGFSFAFQYSFKLCVFITVMFGVAIGAYERLRDRLSEAELKLRTEELERVRAIKLATEARLASLEARVHPHFLFNTLNSISSLIPADPERAERLLERMAALLRFSLDAHRGGLVRLEQEMKIVRDYLEIEKARLGPRLRYEVEAAEDLSSLALPPLSIQTLVENSIKFAVAPNREGGEIRIHTNRGDGWLRIDVCDTGSGFALDSVPPGHGLDNLRGRLTVLFGSDAELTASRANDWTVVSLKVPA